MKTELEFTRSTKKTELERFVRSTNGFTFAIRQWKNLLVENTDQKAIAKAFKEVEFQFKKIEELLPTAKNQLKAIKDSNTDGELN